jgi:hypothetical protein
MNQRLPREAGRRWLTDRMDVRRVVTGHDASGKSVFVSDEAVAAQPLTGFHRLWGGDKAPQFPDDGSLPEHHMYFPPIGGFRFGMFSIPPERVAGSDVNAAAGSADIEAEAPGLLRYLDLSDPGMHTTDTIDFEVVLEGTVVARAGRRRGGHAASRRHGGAERHSTSVEEPRRHGGSPRGAHLRGVPHRRVRKLAAEP